jgi:hypothetical protein
VKQVVCSEHGRQDIGLVCTHVAHAIDSGEPVGFYWGDDADTGRPDAWCAACERALRALRAIPVGQSSASWFLACDYKVLCAACWDVAKHRLYDLQKGRIAET